MVPKISPPLNPRVTDETYFGSLLRTEARSERLILAGESIADIDEKIPLIGDSRDAGIVDSITIRSVKPQLWVVTIEYRRINPQSSDPSEDRPGFWDRLMMRLCP